jgi:hypothetical protein
MFQGRPVEEAKRALRVFPNANDADTAIQKDPAHCAFANACRRMFGSHEVVFFRTIAYVELPDGKGRGATHIERFYLPKAVRRQIIEFDRTGRFVADGYALAPPTFGYTLEHRAALNDAYRASGRAAKAAADRRPEPADVRSGKGVVQFIKCEKKSLKMS